MKTKTKTVILAMCTTYFQDLPQTYHVFFNFQFLLILYKVKKFIKEAEDNNIFRHECMNMISQLSLLAENFHMTNHESHQGNIYNTTVHASMVCMH